MDLGLNLLFLLPGETGGRETYVRGLLPALRRAAPDLRVTAFVGTGGTAVDGVDRLMRLPVGARSRVGWAVGETALVGHAAARAGVDLLHSPANFGPVAGRVPSVVTVHDVGYRDAGGVVAAGSHLLVAAAARHARRVITVSAASRDAIVAGLGVAADHVDVAHNGVQPPPALPATRGTEVLCVAKHLPHKDLPTVIAAHALLPEPRPPLTLVGPGTEALGGRGAVGDDELEACYRNAGVLVLASRYEGFGLPVLEAFGRGVPVVCSDLPVLREVAGDHGAFAPAGDAAAFSRAIGQTLANPPDAAALRAHAARFTWDAAALATLRSYRRALAEPAG